MRYALMKTRKSTFSRGTFYARSSLHFNFKNSHADIHIFFTGGNFLLTFKHFIHFLTYSSCWMFEKRSSIELNLKGIEKWVVWYCVEPNLLSSIKNRFESYIDLCTATFLHPNVWLDLCETALETPNSKAEAQVSGNLTNFQRDLQNRAHQDRTLRCIALPFSERSEGIYVISKLWTSRELEIGVGIGEFEAF